MKTSKDLMEFYKIYLAWIDVGALVRLCAQR